MHGPDDEGTDVSSLTSWSDCVETELAPGPTGDDSFEPNTVSPFGSDPECNVLSDSETQGRQLTGPDRIAKKIQLLLRQGCPCKKQNHFLPFLEPPVCEKLLSFRKDLELSMTLHERRVQLFTVIQKSKENHTFRLFGAALCYKGFHRLLGISPKTVCELQRCRFAPTMAAMRLPRESLKSDVVDSFFKYAYAAFAEDIPNVVGWGIRDMQCIPQAKWKQVTDCLLCPHSELQLSEVSGPVAEMCRQDAKLLPPMGPEDLFLACS